MAIYKGHTFAATELVTSTKLNSLVDSASIALTVSELSTGFLSSLATTSGILRPINLYSITNVATNMSVPNVANKSFLKLYWSTYGSIASLTGMTSGQQFTLMAAQASFPAILDGGAFTLSADWIANGANDNITLVWDGSSFIETARVNT